MTAAGSIGPAGVIVPPRAFRSDTVGIFAVLALAGLAQVITGSPPATVARTVPDLASTLWSVSLLVFGTVGIVSCFLPTRLALAAVGLHLAARVALAAGSAAYALAIVARTSLLDGSFLVAVTYAGICVLNLTAAHTLRRWSRDRRELVEAVLKAQERGEL